MKVGDFVRFRATHGSIGKIEERSGSRLYVVWVYGRDRAGNVVRACSGYSESSASTDLEIITEAEYLAARDRKFK